MEDVLCFVPIDNFPYAQAIVIVLELNGRAGLRHLLQLPARRPCVRPRAVIGGIADGIVGNRLVGQSQILCKPLLGCE